MAKIESRIQTVNSEDLNFFQEILNRIEFFPIKCRIQNAKENFRKYQKDLKSSSTSWRHDGNFLSQNQIKVLNSDAKLGIQIVAILFVPFYKTLELSAAPALLLSATPSYLSLYADYFLLDYNCPQHLKGAGRERKVCCIAADQLYRTGCS